MAANHQQLVLDWKNPLAAKTTLVGGKAANLFLLRKYGFIVPRWWVVSTVNFQEVFRALQPKIARQLNGLNYQNQRQLQASAAAIEALILRYSFPEKLWQECQKKMNPAFSDQPLFAVRSSLLGEDSARNSFAGLMNSYLDVQFAEIPAKIKQVWASAFSPRALVYRHKKGLDPLAVSAAVIIQKMIRATSAGVMFSDDPESRGKYCLISAGFGLGEGVVSNQVETDTYRVDRQSGQIKKDIAEKINAFIYSPMAETTHRLEALPSARRYSPVLNDKQIRALSKIAAKAAQNFRQPQDIEWAYDQQGRLFILQSRPIVFSPGGSIWDNANIIESYPGLTLPLTFSFIQDCYETAFSNTTGSFLLQKKTLNKCMPVFREMLGLLNGRVYYNLLSWYRMLSFLPGFEKHKAAWDEMIGIEEAMDFPGQQLSLLNRCYGWLFITWKLLSGKNNARQFFRQFNAFYKTARDWDIANATENELINYYHSIAHSLSGFWHRTLFNDFSAMKYYHWLKQICQRWGLEKHSNLHNDLLTGESGVESVAPGHMLIRLAEKVRGNPLYRALFKDENIAIIRARIQYDPAFATLKTSLANYLRHYGDRSFEELKLETPGFREAPERLLQYIRHYAESDLSVETLERQDLRIRKNAETIVRQTLRHPLKRLFFAIILRNCRLAVKNRENMRFARSRFFGLIRRIFRRFGELFATNEIIPAADIFYLTHQEIFATVTGSSVTENLPGLVALRKAEYAQYESRQLPERFITRGIPDLNNLQILEDFQQNNNLLQGTGCASGVVQAPAQIVHHPEKAHISGDHILVAKSTDPGWVFLMLAAKGIIVEKGSVLSHTAIIGRELGIPTIIGVKNATRQIPNGSLLRMDGGNGEIVISEKIHRNGKNEG